MAHFARLDENNIVLEVIVVNNDDIQNLPFPESESVGIAYLNSFLPEANWKLHIIITLDLNMQLLEENFIQSVASMVDLLMKKWQMILFGMQTLVLGYLLYLTQQME
jgi:S-adenosylhomocysteine hydrolase